MRNQYPTKKNIDVITSRLRLETKKTISFDLPLKVIQELAALHKLMDKVQPNKIRKMVRDIRSNNLPFHQYLNQRRLNTIKYEDFAKFEEQYARDCGVERIERKVSKKSMQVVRMGFQELRRKLQEYEMTDFVNEINYYATTFEREAKKLQSLGVEYQGLHLVRNPHNFTFELMQEQLQNGQYTKISRNLIRKTELIEAAQCQFKRAIKQE